MGKNPQNPLKKPLQDYAKYSGLGFQMLVTILLGSYAGVKLDGYFQISSHIFTIIFSLVSVGAAIWMVVKKIS